MNRLYGDGIHDDSAAIQEMLDTRRSVIELPVPEKHYLISKTLKIYSNQTLKLGETTTIRLMAGSSCFMLKNAEEDAHDIAVVGGIWDYNNKNQAPNPIRSGEYRKYSASHRDGDPNTVVKYVDTYRGSVMRFYKITRLSIHDLTIKDPVTYCVEMAYIKYFTVENVRFDQNLGNPTAENMDGIHVDGGCQYGSIRNVQGTCYDDVVALNADDGCDGPIEDILIDGVFGNDSLRGVRLLSTKSQIARISISNVFGTFYQNCIGLTYFYPRSGVRGKMSHISIKNIYGKNAPRIPEYGKGDNSNFPFAFVWVDGDLDIDSLTVDNLFRKEEISNVESLKVCKGAYIKTLSLSNILHQNATERSITLFTNEGVIDKLYMYNVDPDGDELLKNHGTIGSVKEILL
ncbi:MAG: hypothetical protein IKJ91_01990 [Clostridia bacterium]|nr:hypothetical protein [Clostridia bacterium]